MWPVCGYESDGSRGKMRNMEGAATGKPLGLSVLLVEDHVDSARALARLLQSMGHQVQTAHTLGDANKLATNGQYQLLISDLKLPDGSGLDLIKKMRASTPTLKAIAISGFSHATDLQACKDAGFDTHVTKPVDFIQFRAVVETTLRS
jgi:hypothetical protein